MERALNTEGWLHVDPLSADQATAVRAHFAQCGPLPGYLPGRLTPFERSKPYSIEDCARRGRFACYPLSDVLAAPHLLDRALAEDVLIPVREYLGAEPALYSANAFWSFPQPHIQSTQLMHRDFDGGRVAALFISLTYGAEQYYLPGSHDPTRFRRMVAMHGFPGMNYDVHKALDIHESYLSRFPVIRLLGGPAGRCALTLPEGLHAGVPCSEPRLMVWFRYGTGPNEAYFNDKTEPVVVPGRETTAATALLIRGE